MELFYLDSSSYSLPMVILFSAFTLYLSLSVSNNLDTNPSGSGWVSFKAKSVQSLSSNNTTDVMVKESKATLD
jgi:hypothetical protein